MATHAHTTDPRRRRSTRRALLAGSTALTIAAAGAATIGIRPTDDAALMRAVDHFRGCHAAVLALEARTDHEWSEVEKAGEAWNEAADELCAIAPITPAGLAAKAGAMMMALRAEVGDFTRPEAFEARAEPHDRLAMALAQDVLRLAGGAA
jgi:hypothetical protein